MNASRNTIAPATPEERSAARTAAAALKAAIADPSTMGERTVMHLNFARPRRGEWRETWANLPGFRRVNRTSYVHDLLPGWEYNRSEIRSEMIPDLEVLAEHGTRPTKATR